MQITMQISPVAQTFSKDLSFTKGSLHDSHV